MSSVTTGIWYGWKHLQKPLDQLNDPLITRESLSWDCFDKQTQKVLEIIQNANRHLLYPDLTGSVKSTECPIIDQDTIQKKILGQIYSVIRPNSFLIRYRILEVIDAGNAHGLFLAISPYLAAPLPRSPQSPFQHLPFDQYANSFALLKNSYVGALKKSYHPVDPVARLGKLFYSAMIFGGLVVTRWVLMLPAVVRLQSQPKHYRWVDIPLCSPTASIDEMEQADTRRWIPDPLTRLMLIQEAAKLPSLQVLGQQLHEGRWLMKALREYAKFGYFSEQLPTSLKDLHAAIRVHLNCHLPPLSGQLCIE